SPVSQPGAPALRRSGRFTHCAHWGAFYAVVEDGRLVDALPFEGDPTPSPILSNLPEAVQGPARVRQPMVREDWLKRRGASRNSRGTGRFVPVGWDRALDLVAEELARVRALHGPASVYSGSYGWSSAGRFHHAKSQLQR